MLYLRVLSAQKILWTPSTNISGSIYLTSAEAENSADILIQIYVMSKFDYCSSLLYDIPDKLLNHIQRIQTYAARMILKLHKFIHITPVLAPLHWLPANCRMDFTMALLVYKGLNGQAQACIRDLLKPYDPPGKLR